MGAYRPPLGAAGAALDRVMLHRAALATVRSLLTDIAGSLLAPGAEAGRVVAGGGGARAATGRLGGRAGTP